MTEDFRANLRHLCAERGSVAGVCRELSINQQQFSKYLSGRARPSAANLRKISRYFNVLDRDLFREQRQFVSWYRDRVAVSGGAQRSDPFASAFPGDSKSIRAFLGAYQFFYTSPAVPGRIIVAAAFLDQVAGTVHSRTMESPFSHQTSRRQWTRGNGKAGYLSDRLFIVDCERGDSGSLTSTILVPPHRYRNDLIFGEMIFLASYPRRHPTSSRTVWSRIPATWSAKDLLRTCGSLPERSTSIRPAIRKYLLERTSTIPPLDSEA